MIFALLLKHWTWTRAWPYLIDLLIRMNTKHTFYLNQFVTSSCLCTFYKLFYCATFLCVGHWTVANIINDSIFIRASLRITPIITPVIGYDMVSENHPLPSLCVIIDTFIHTTYIYNDLIARYWYLLRNCTIAHFVWDPGVFIYNEGSVLLYHWKEE